MKDKIMYSAMLVELDTLFDTRLSVLNSINPDIAVKAIQSGYFNRVIDEFPGIDFEEFKGLYDNRDKRVLQHTIVTPIAMMINEFITTTLNQVAVTPYNFKPKVILNIYPYKLLDSEVNCIVNGLVSITKGLCDIETINLPYGEITPRYLKQNVSIMVLYEYYKWLEENSLNEQLKHHSCPEVSLLAPNIYFKPLPSTRLEDDPFRAMEQITEMFIKLRFITIDNFCFLRPKAQ